MIKRFLCALLSAMILLSVGCSQKPAGGDGEGRIPVTTGAGRVPIQPTQSAAPEPTSPTADPSSGSADALVESADFKMPKMLSSGCVLQQSSIVTIWGTYQNDCQLNLTFNGSRYTTACKDGDFSFRVQTPAASLDTYEIVIDDGAKKKTISNVAVGEVFLCGGQSNMVFFGVELREQPTDLVKGNPHIRFINTQAIGKRSEVPLADAQGIWYTYTEDNFINRSVFGSYFAAKMFEELNVPIGIVTCAMSDSSLAAWLTAEDAKALNNENTAESAPYYQHTPGQLYNVILSSFLQYTFKAAVWYQGESSHSAGYAHNLSVFINKWRDYLHTPELPFVIVQLPGYDAGNWGPTCDWPTTRMAQKTVANTVPNCAYSVNIDLGEKANIHPNDKKPAAERAANEMLRLVYGKDTPAAALFKSASISGDRITVSFENASGLYLKDTGGVGFEVSYDGTSFTAVDAASVSVSGDQLVISGVSGAKAVRYAWKNWPEVSVFNGNDLPAEPFSAAL